MIALIEGAVKPVFPQKIFVIFGGGLPLVPKVSAVLPPRKLQYDHRGNYFDSYA